MDVVDAFDLGITLVDHRIEGHVTQGLEGRVERAERLHAGVGADGFVVIERGDAHLVLDLHDRLGKAAFRPGLGGALVALDGERIDVAARKAPLGGDHVGRHTLRHKILREGAAHVDGPGATVRAHGDAAHALDATADGHGRLARHHLGGGDIDGLKTRGAETIDLGAGGILVIARRQDRGAGDVAALLADRRHAAPRHVVDQLGIQVVAIAQFRQDLRRQVERGDLMQRAVLLALAARRAQMIVDIG